MKNLLEINARTEKLREMLNAAAIREHIQGERFQITVLLTSARWALMFMEVGDHVAARDMRLMFGGALWALKEIEELSDGEIECAERLQQWLVEVLP